MDVFTEKEIVDCLKSMAVSLRNIDRKMDDMTMSLRELAASELDEGIEGDIVEEVIEDNSESLQ